MPSKNMSLAQEVMPGVVTMMASEDRHDSLEVGSREVK